MYNSYYSQTNCVGQKNSKAYNMRKSTSQYLFLNQVRIFSVIYLILTIFYIPVYLGIGDINSSYFDNNQQNITYSQQIFLQGTIFALKSYQNCYQNEIDFKTVKDLVNTQQFSIQNDPTYCFTNKVNFLPFIKTVEQFHTFYFSYFLIMYLITFLAVIIAQHLNKKLFIQLEYPNQVKNHKEKLESKKIFHVSCELNDVIYFTKPTLKKKIEMELIPNQKISVKNINICLNQNFRKYAELFIESKGLEQKIEKQKNLLFENFENKEKDDEISEQILRKKEKLQRVNFELSYLLLQIQNVLGNKENYHYGHFWVCLQKFSDCLKLQKYILNLKRNKIMSKFIKNIGTIQQQDLLIQNIENRQIITFLSSIDKNWNDQFWTKFIPNQRYKNLNKGLQVLKVLTGSMFCILLIIILDVVILMIKRSEIFSYPTILVVLVLEIILKILINKLSQLERHSRFSHLKLAIMLKLTVFTFVNLVVILFLSTYDLGSWSLGKKLSTYQLNRMNQDWYSTIGSSIILTVITQIIFCNLRVYTEILKNVLLKFLQKHLFNILKVSKVKQRIIIWIDQLRMNYHKPIIDLQVCYAQILPVYMIGIVFGYFFPILYILLFIFSITIHITHQNYVEYETEKFLYNGVLFNNWSYNFLYLSFLGGLIVVAFAEWENNVFVFITFGIVCIILLVKKLLSNLDKMILQKLQKLSIQQQNEQKQNQQVQNNEKTNKIQHANIDNKNTERQLNPQTNLQSQPQIQPEIKQIKSQFINKLLKQKHIELILLELFGSQFQNINQIHAQYYQKYKEMVQKEMLYCKMLQDEFSKQC